jgi:hypothetical protein
MHNTATYQDQTPQDSPVWPPNPATPPAPAEGFFARHARGLSRTATAAGAVVLGVFGMLRGPAMVDAYQHADHIAASQSVSRLIGPLTQALLEQIPDDTVCESACTVGNYHDTALSDDTSRYKVEVIVFEDGSGIDFIGVKDEPGVANSRASFSITYSTEGSEVLRAIRAKGKNTYTKKDYKAILAEQTTSFLFAHTTVGGDPDNGFSSIATPDDIQYGPYDGGVTKIVVKTGQYDSGNADRTTEGDDFYYSRLDAALNELSKSASSVIAFAQSTQNSR